jgi:uncharacterized RDD family membrane protein YckC
MSEARVPYAGLVTRAIALAVDVAIVHAIVFAAGAVLALVASLVADVELDTPARIALACAWTGTVCAYFVGFWNLAGQTPGMRLMDVRVNVAEGGPPSIGRSIIRLIGLALAIVPLFAGFVPVLVDNRRRGLHDFLAGTVVVHTDAGMIMPTP